MTENEKEKSPQPNVHLACIEISRFRRLSAVRVPINAETTILVGANNSGKTSILHGLWRFLTENPAFGAFDFSVDIWPKLRQLGEEWEALDADPVTDASNPVPWDQHLLELLGCMPMLDLWFNVKPGAYHVVFPFLPSLQWSGGPIGVRLRLEPASNIDELQKLAWHYRQARQPVLTHEASARAWPTDLLDYWLMYTSDLSRVAVHRLDPEKGPLAANPPGEPQELPVNAVPLNRADLIPLIRVDFVAAQRGLGSEEADDRPGKDPHRMGLFSKQMQRFASKHLSSDALGSGDHPELIAAVAKAQQDLDDKILSALDPTIKDVRKLGYPGLHDPREIHFRTRIQTADLLDHKTAVQYRLEGHNTFLPEHAIGLGYQNLQSLSFQLVSFRETRVNPAKGIPAAVHVVMLEEPEAHLHVQVQRIFTRRALELIAPGNDDHAHLASQLILTTHSSHLAHAVSFTNLRYVRRRMPLAAGAMADSDVVNLADVFGDDDKTRTFAERYFQVQHTDLLFADAAIVVEGTAERMLVPFFIERDCAALRSRYLSFLSIGGSHAHRLRPLVERLGIPTVVITDIDPVKVTKSAGSRRTKRAEAIIVPSDLVCGNDTLRKWHPKHIALVDFGTCQDDQKVWSNNQGSRVRFAWQVPISSGGPWPSSFEDAFILTNSEWFKNRIGAKGNLGKAVRVVKEHSDLIDLNKALHDLLHGSFDKGEFAATLFERLYLGENLRCPTYISDALAWLEKELKPANVEEQPQ